MQRTITAIALVLITASCAKSGVQESGGTLKLPPKHQLAEFIQSQHLLESLPNEHRAKLDIVFRKWDGQYPPGWLKGIELPAATYVFYNASLAAPLPDDHMSGSRKQYALIKDKPDALIAQFGQQFKSSGCRMIADEDLPRGPNGWGMHRFIGTPPDSTSGLQLWVYRIKSLDGYTFLEMDWDAF